MPEEVDAFTLRPIADDDTAPVRRLWNDRFGRGATRQNKWLAAALDPAHSVVGLVAEAAHGAVVGFGLLDVAGREHTRQYLGLDVLDFSLRLADRNGILHMYCVETDWEGRGIGSALFRRHLRILAEREARRAFGISWHRPEDKPDSRALFEKSGFEAVATVERYYERTNPREQCPACGGPCSCTATVYAQHFTSC